VGTTALRAPSAFGLSPYGPSLPIWATTTSVVGHLQTVILKRFGQLDGRCFHVLERHQHGSMAAAVRVDEGVLAVVRIGEVDAHLGSDLRHFGQVRHESTKGDLVCRLHLFKSHADRIAPPGSQRSTCRCGTGSWDPQVARAHRINCGSGALGRNWRS